MGLSGLNTRSQKMLQQGEMGLFSRALVYRGFRQSWMSWIWTWFYSTSIKSLSMANNFYREGA